MSKVKLGFLKPLMTDLYMKEASWETIKDRINEELASNNIIVNGKLYQMITVKDVQELFRLASFDLSKRPKFKGRKARAEDIFEFDEGTEGTEETKNVEETEELVSAW